MLAVLINKKNKKMCKNLLLLSMLFLLLACQKKDKQFQINGVVKNVADSSLVYAHVGETIVDSAWVVDGKFTLSNKITEPTEVQLVLNENEDYTTVWVDNESITYFEADKGHFQQAHIRGSQTQKEDEILMSYLKAPYAAWDKIEASYKESFTAEEIKNYEAQLDKNKKDTFDACIKFIKEYPDSYVSSSLINGYSTTWGAQQTQIAFNLLTDANKATKSGVIISKFISINKTPKVGDVYTDFEIPNIDGQLIKLSDIHKKVTLLEFWASNCGACRRDNPKLVETYKKFHDKGFDILGVSLDEDATNWKKAIKKDGLLWEQVGDLSKRNEAVLIYGVLVMPSNFLIDENGVIVGKDLIGKELDDRLNELL